MKLTTRGRYAVTAMLDLAMHGESGPVALADISDRQRAMLDFAMKVRDQAEAIEDDDFARLRAAGFDDEDIWDIAGITAFFGLSNRMANFLSMRPNDEFFAMGRG